MFLPQLKGSSRNSAVEAAVIAANGVADAVIAAARSVIPNGKNAWFRSAACPKPSRAARR